MTEGSGVRELRVAVTVRDYDAAKAFYRDVLGLTEVETFEGPEGRGVVLAAGRATLELLDEAEAARVDQLEVGRRVAGHIRLALEVDDSAAVTERLAAAGATVLGPPKPTPWGHVNARVAAAEDLQLTLFSPEDAGADPT
ncbi:MAG TPA: VOC family protein [Nocardioidaceae bacterium]|nr:VOC family protein [Nocardioidaceae bacterium]